VLETYGVQFIGYPDIRPIAAGFRKKVAISDDEMVPEIDLIIEKQLGIEIVPVPDLYVATSGVGAFLTASKDEIYVDQRTLDHDMPTYRFGVTHEISHLYLHEGLWDRADFRSITEFAEWWGSLDPVVHAALEFQASAFASLVLVPSRLLKPVFQKTVALNIAKLRGLQIRDKQSAFDICYRATCSEVAPEFQVHQTTIGVRADFDALPDQLAVDLFGPDHGLVTRKRWHR